MYQAYKFRIYPTAEQQTYFAGAFGCCRWFWNYSLNLCQQTYKDTGKGLSRSAIQGLLPNLKKEYPWLTNAYSQSLQVVALNLSTAYKNLFDRRGGFPSFKPKHLKKHSRNLKRKQQKLSRKQKGSNTSLSDAVPREVGSPISTR